VYLNELHDGFTARICFQVWAVQSDSLNVSVLEVAAVDLNSGKARPFVAIA
jgi:hypothetical protein